jgi:hypothetical protein
MKMNIPEQCENLFIDVGLAIDAPNAATWLYRDRKSFVIGVEPNPENIAVLRKGRSPDFHLPYLCLDDDCVLLKGESVCKIENRFHLIQCAIDDVDSPTTAPFYMTDERNTGCSSLLKPTEKLGLDVKQVYETPVNSLKQILDEFYESTSQFSYITALKSDAQGKDLDVIKSARDYLGKILFVKMEVRTNGQYENEQKVSDIEEFMKKNKFNLYHDSHYDHVYINYSLLEKIDGDIDLNDLKDIIFSVL